MNAYMYSMWMKVLKGAELAKKIIKESIYLTLATSWKDKPWASPVCYFTDAEGNFYYASQMHSVHTKNILKNPKVSWAIFDSHAAEGTGVGVQIKGRATLVGPRAYQRIVHSGGRDSIRAVLDYPLYRLFKLTPQRMFVTDPESEVDKREEVSLKRLTSSSNPPQKEHH
jgi:uncharacterized protein YhbP (UPF0306 family)